MRGTSLLEADINSLALGKILSVEAEDTYAWDTSNSVVVGQCCG